MRQLGAVLAAGALVGAAVPMAAAQMKHGDKGTGVVTNVERNAGKVTLRHEAIASLNWPAMTMAFTVQDKALLDKLPKDAKVDFEFVQQGKQYVITAIK